MANEQWSAERARGITRRLVVEGDLVLHTPLHLGNGDADGLVDLPLLRDPLDDRPLVPGTTLAGALRAYLEARERGSDGPSSANRDDSAAVRLFGGDRSDEEGAPSALIVDDAWADRLGVERRDGVKLDPETRTAKDQKKFDLELWPAGTRFPLRYELVLTRQDDQTQLVQALATALAGLSDPIHGIRLGARKHRGYGQGRVDRWRVTTYDLTTAAGLLAWLAAADDPEAARRWPAPVAEGSDLAALLGVPSLLPDRRRWLHLEAAFTLEGSLLIRAGTGQDDRGPDVIHLHAQQVNGADAPILSGTSLAGALRARALRIACTLAVDAGAARKVTDSLFGADLPDRNAPIAERRPTAASRLTVDERVLAHACTDLVQNRVRIDRFTGGAFPSGLFNAQPAFGSPETTVTIGLRVADPTDPDLGLLLLLLKDLWTSDLPLGGESGVGRGRLWGREATLRWHAGDPPGAEKEWTLMQDGPRLTITGDRDRLEEAVAALTERLGAAREPIAEREAPGQTVPVLVKPLGTAGAA